MSNYPNGFDDSTTLTPITPGEGATPAGPAGGDLGGTYPNPTVTKLTITGATAGAILYFNGTNWVVLAPGSEGKVLTSHGSNPPTWE